MPKTQRRLLGRATGGAALRRAEGPARSRPLAGAALLALLLSHSAFTVEADAQGADPRSVPADFLRFLTLPGMGDDFLRPAAIALDRRHAEVFVADAGHNRIVILDEQGTFRHEFDGGDHFAMPLDLAVDSEGYIYVLGTTRDGHRIFRLDFDGRFLEMLDLPPGGSVPADIISLDIDADDRLFALDRTGCQVLVLDRRGQLLSSFPLITDLDPVMQREQVFGSITARHGLVFVPIPSLGTVHVHWPAAGFVRALGHKGNNIGELNFPVAVDLTSEELVLVLDKHRFTVVCFDLEGRFLGEFGGKGISPGWFYHPTLLAVDTRDQVYVGQIFRNRIQVLRIPLFITAAHLQHRMEDAESAPAMGAQGELVVPEEIRVFTGFVSARRQINGRNATS